MSYPTTWEYQKIKFESDYRTRKAMRVAEFNRQFGKKTTICTACSGSGYYDDCGSPICSSCNGTGKERER